MKEQRGQRKIKCELYNDSMQGWKCYPIQKAQLIIADVPYNVGTNFYGSNPMWYVGGITRMARANLQEKQPSLRTSTSTSLSIFTFVPG